MTNAMKLLQKHLEIEREIEMIENQKGEMGHEPDLLHCKRGWGGDRKI